MSRRSAHSMTKIADEVTRTYAEYFEAFQTLNVAAVLPYFHFPFTIITPVSVTAVASVTEGRALLATMMHGLKASGYESSEWSNLLVKPLSDDTALLSARVVRFKADGEELQQFGATYLFRLADGAWRIAVLVMHDPD